MRDIPQGLMARFSVVLLSACRAWNVAPLDSASVRAYADELLTRWELSAIERAIELHKHDTLRGHRLPSAVDLRRILATSERAERTGAPQLTAPEVIAERVSAEFRMQAQAEALSPRLRAMLAAAYARDRRESVGAVAGQGSDAGRLIPAGALRLA